MTCAACSKPIDNFNFSKINGRAYHSRCDPTERSDHRGIVASVHPSERSVVWHHPGTGQVRYPGSNQSPMPERYRRQGYERLELDSLRKLDQFQKKHRVVNEKAHYDRNGRGYDGHDE